MNGFHSLHNVVGSALFYILTLFWTSLVRSIHTNVCPLVNSTGIFMVEFHTVFKSVLFEVKFVLSEYKLFQLLVRCWWHFSWVFFNSTTHWECTHQVKQFSIKTEFKFFDFYLRLWHFVLFKRRCFYKSFATLWQYTGIPVSILVPFTWFTIRTNSLIRTLKVRLSESSSVLVLRRVCIRIESHWECFVLFI